MATKHNGVWHQVSEEAPHPQHPRHSLQLLDIRGDISLGKKKDLQQYSLVDGPLTQNSGANTKTFA